MPPSLRTRPVRARPLSDPAPGDPEPERYYLVVDRRFRAPVYVFLAEDPHGEPGFPGLGVREVTLASPPAGGSTPLAAIGADPALPDSFREFRSDGHARAAGFALIEPRYVGPTWAAYLAVFRPDGPPRSRPPANGQATRRPG
jgi:hypothetical protein